MAKEFLKKDKVCLVCGTGFKATGKAITCGGTCRAILFRFSKSGTKPQYCLLAKSKGQELPAWVAALMTEPAKKEEKKETADTSAEKEKLPKNESKALTYFEKRQKGLI